MGQVLLWEAKWNRVGCAASLRHFKKIKGRTNLPPPYVSQWSVPSDSSMQHILIYCRFSHFKTCAISGIRPKNLEDTFDCIVLPFVSQWCLCYQLYSQVSTQHSTWVVVDQQRKTHLKLMKRDSQRDSSCQSSFIIGWAAKRKVCLLSFLWFFRVCAIVSSFILKNLQMSSCSTLS